MWAMDGSNADEIDTSNSFEDDMLQICSESEVPNQNLQTQRLRVVSWGGEVAKVAPFSTKGNSDMLF